MPQSLTQIYLHIIFSTKNRQPFLNNEQIREQTHAYLAGICKNLQCPSLLVGGVADHVHLLTRHSKNVAVADFIGTLKRDSSKWVKEKDRELTSFYWQKGYGAFSVSPSHAESVREYIATQAEHHRGESFQDEFRRLCKKYGVELDERYVWD